MTNRNSIRAIFNSELKTVVTDHSILLTVIIAPLLYAFFLGSIYLNKDIDQIRFAVVDYDNSKTSRTLTRMLSASQKIDMVGYLEDYEDGVERLMNLEIQGFLIFNDGFEQELMKMDGANLNLYLNTTRFLPSNDLNMAVNEVMLLISSGIRLKYYERKGINQQLAMQIINPLTAEIKPIYNTTNSYGGFLLPGLFFLILQQTLLIGLGESVSRDNEKGMLNSSLTGSPFGVSNYIFGKLSYYILLYVAYLIIFTAVIFPFFGLPVAGSIISIFVLTLVFLITIMLLTMFIGTFISSQIRMMEILAFTSYPFFLLSGYSWPVSAMPLPLQWLAALIPTTPMMEVMKRLYIMGADWGDVVHQFQHLIILLIVTFVLLIWRLITIRNRVALKMTTSTK
ncbi:MAG: ABC transporter permease [Bacteroidetes bacterium]|nr:ABC transporter permease [Bacteroidota bacterium]MBL6944554.1 ABC transporter permease [Bacteroidales bacterium]